MTPPAIDPFVAALITLLSGGSGKFVYDAVKQWRNAPPRALRNQTVVDANIATVARARDELEEDNARLRKTLAEERKQRNEDEARHAVERLRWEADQERLRAEMARLEIQIRAERDEAAARYNALLQTVHQLQLRANTPEEQR